MTSSSDRSPAVDLAHMTAALALARRGLGRVWPNPAVGCVLVRPDLDGRVVGRGWTQPGGRPHAETEALARAGDLARGATAYVTLEPCAHVGRTPPCADALIAAGIARAVLAIEDPDPRVGGRGAEKLLVAKINVTVGVGADAAAEVNAGFLTRLQKSRPLVTLKLAASLDGRIATAGGDSKWITGAAARARTHLLRAGHDAVLIGAGTALADDPELTCRLPGMADWRPVRIVLDGKLRLPPTSKLARTARETPTWIVTAAGADKAKADDLRAAGAEIVEVQAGEGGRPDIAAALAALAQRGLTRVLIEGGGTVAAALLKADLVDRVAWFAAPTVIGGDGVPAVAALEIARVSEAPRFVMDSVCSITGDSYCLLTRVAE